MKSKVYDKQGRERIVEMCEYGYLDGEDMQCQSEAKTKERGKPICWEHKRLLA